MGRGRAFERRAIGPEHTQPATHLRARKPERKSGERCLALKLQVVHLHPELEVYHDDLRETCVPSWPSWRGCIARDHNRRFQEFIFY
jgi:hypothetical protein